MNNLNSTKINYISTNKKEFIEWFNKTFIKFRATGKEETKTIKITIINGCIYI